MSNAPISANNPMRSGQPRAPASFSAPIRSGRSDLTLIDAGFYQAETGDHYPPHTHETWEMILYQAGHIQCVVDGSPIDTRPGFMLVVPPRTVHHDVAVGRYSQYFIQFRTQQAHPWLLEAPHEADPALEFVFASIARESDGHASHREELLGLLLAQFEVLLERSHQRQPRSRLERLVHQVEAIFQERHRERLSLTALVEELGISEATLRYQFQQVRGKAPKTVLQEIRTRNALRLIGSSSLNLDEIAARCGFDSASHLARFVKQYTGHTPGQFRSLETDRN